MASTPQIGVELQALPLGFMLGAPMKATIEAQALAANETVKFIEKVGLEEDDVTGELKVRSADFSFNQPIPDPANPGEFVDQESTLTVPILTIVPVPYIRVSDLNVSFEFKIRDVQTAKSKKEFTGSLGIEHTTEVQAKMGGGLLGFFGGPKGEMNTRTKVDVSVSATYQRTDRHTTDRSATFKMTLNAVQDAIPEGLSRTLTILNDAIVARKK